MPNIARRYAGLAATALAVGGLVTTLAPFTPGLSDVQIRDFDLAAAAVNSVAALDIVENHIRPELVGSGATDGQHIDLGELLFGGGGDGPLGAGATEGIGEVDDTIFTELAGGNFDPQQLPLGLPFAPDLSSVEAPIVGTFGGGGEQGANNVTASAVAGMSFAISALPDAQQAANAAIVAMQAEFNSSLVAAQQATADRLFGDSPELNGLVNWIFYLNNSVLAQNQALFNSMFGISFDSHGSLLGNFAPEVAEVDWSSLLGFSPEQFNEIVNAIQADNLALLLGSIDWDSLFAGLF